jgi:hypothetical protein
LRPGFLKNRGEAAGLVAGARIGVHLGAFALGVFFPPAHQPDELFADLAADRAPGQEMFGAISLRRLRQDHGAAMGNQKIARHAERRIG